MHELSIALSLLDMTCERLRTLGDVRVDAVHIRIGRFSGVERDALAFCFDGVVKGTAIQGARLEIEDVPLTIDCRRCECERRVDDIQHLRCPVCGEPAHAIVAGRELELAALEVSDAAHR